MAYSSVLSVVSILSLLYKAGIPLLGQLTNSDKSLPSVSHYIVGPQL